MEAAVAKLAAAILTSLRRLLQRLVRRRSATPIK
jgi:hypothetical protein